MSAAALVATTTGCDMPMFAVDVQLSEVCTTRDDLVFAATPGDDARVINVRDLDVDLTDALDTTFELSRTGFATADDAGFAGLRRVELSLRGVTRDGVDLPEHLLFERTFGGAGDDDFVMVEHDPPIDVTDYWRGLYGALAITVEGDWGESWRASLDVCLDVSASYAADWPR